VGQLEKRLYRYNSAARGQIMFKFHKMVLRGSRKMQNCQNPLKAESKMVENAHIFNIRAPISLERQILDFKFGVCTDDDE